MTEKHRPMAGLKARLAASSSFDLVGIARCLAEILGPLPDETTIEGDDALSQRLAEALGTRLDRKAWIRRLEPSLSGDLAREILGNAIEDPNLEPVLGQAIDRHEQDESMNAIEILAYGVAISLIILVATTRVEWKQGKPTRIVKETLDSKTIQRLLDLMPRGGP
jgi:hypothetical protein